MQQKKWLVQCKVLLLTAGFIWLAAWLTQSTPVSEPAVAVQTSIQIGQPVPADGYLLSNLVRHPAVLFQHAKQQPLYLLWQEFGLSPLAALPLRISASFCQLPWYVLAGSCASFRLGLWQDANLHAKRLYYEPLS